MRTLWYTFAWHDTPYGPGRPIQLLAKTMTGGYMSNVFFGSAGLDTQNIRARMTYYYKDVTRP